MIFGEGPIIKNIAGDLNKLFLQGSHVGQPITNVEGDAAADQGTVDLLAAMDPVIQEVAVGMSGEESRHYTVSGTPPLSLANSLGMPLRSWSVDVLPYQEGTGDPSPSNMRPIHGTDSLTITTAGKNLAKFIKDGYVPSISSGNLVLYGNGIRTDYIDVLGETEYTLSSTSVNTSYIFQYDRNKTFIGYSIVRTVTTDSNCAYLMLRIDTTDLDINAQLELGSTASDYVPYIAPSQTVLTLPQTVYTGTIGSDGGESRWGIYQPTASEMFWSSSSKASFYIPSWVDTSTMRGNAICSHFARFVGGWVELPVNSFQAHVDRVGINIENVSDTAGAQAYVQAQIDAGTPIQFLFELATPTTFAVPSVTIPTPTGTATTWATAEDGIVDGMEVTYVGKA